MIPGIRWSPDIRWSPGIRWSPAIWWSPAIRWSIRSMDFDKPKVYGDTFISDGLVFYFFVHCLQDGLKKWNVTIRLCWCNHIWCQIDRKRQKLPSGSGIRDNLLEKWFIVQGIEDPAKQCLDILCFDPITWVGTKEEVCRSRNMSWWYHFLKDQKNMEDQYCVWQLVCEFEDLE